MSPQPFSLIVALACGLSLSSCSSYRQQAGVIDGLVEAGAGAAVPEQSQRRDYERYGIPPEESRNELAPAEDPQPAGSQYPIAQPTANPEEVLSPYPPHHKINISGFSSGQFAKDPKNGKIFRLP